MAALIPIQSTLWENQHHSGAPTGSNQRYGKPTGSCIPTSVQYTPYCNYCKMIISVSEPLPSRTPFIRRLIIKRKSKSGPCTYRKTYLFSPTMFSEQSEGVCYKYRTSRLCLKAVTCFSYISCHKRMNFIEAAGK